MDSNNSSQDTSDPNDTSSKYQDILDQYSKQVTKSPDTEEETEDQPIINPDEVLKTVTPEPTPVSPPPEPISLLMENQPPVVKESQFFKILFYFSILTFLTVASILAFSFINGSQTGNNSVNPAIPTTAEPTNTPESESFCYLNDNKYKLNESFPSADGCNTCTCGLDGTIVCTEKACNE
jgi:hypothetical protein